jgi:spore germination protein KA
MWFINKNKKKQENQQQPDPKVRKDKLSDLFEMLNESEDFISGAHKMKNMTVQISYIKPMVDNETVHRDIMPYMIESDATTLEELVKVLPYTTAILTKDIKEIKEKILTGFIYIQPNKKEPQGLLLNAVAKNGRSVSPPEVEFSVIGPKESFIESIDTNISLVRKRLPLPNFKTHNLTIGKITKTKVAVLYIQGIANEENVNTMVQRLQDVEYDQIIDSSFLTQMIADNDNSPFPQLIDTERPDRVVSGLVEGKVAVIVDGSPFAVMGPTTIMEFFTAFDDYALVWYLATFFRVIRLISVAFSVLATPLYVAVLTYHYQLVPKDLMGTLISSRMGIPFPPIMEALLLEITIEVLREAGVRLPTKVGQTIGIVGGIVIGTASVQANMTSNVLLILVAMAALASFTTPNYKMNNSVRLIRFPFLIAASIWGMLGIAACFALFVSHLLKLTSLGRPYIEPFFPLRISDLKDAFVRLPFRYQGKRPLQLRPEDPARINSKRASAKHDIDE